MASNLVKFIIAGLFSLNVLASNSNSILAILDKEVITTNDIRQAVKDYRKNNSNSIDKALLVQLLNAKINAELQRQYAKKINIQIKPEVLQQRIARLAKQNNLSMVQFRKLPHYDDIVQALSDRAIFNGLRNIITKQITEVSKTLVDKVYQIELAKKTQYQVANIILKDKNQAEQLIKQLRQNSDLFAQIASATSLAMTARDGGDLGYSNFEGLPKLYQNIVANLNIGQISDIIIQQQEDKNLYHIIKLKSIKQATDLFTTQVKVNHIFMEEKNALNQISSTSTQAFVTMLSIYQQLKSGANFASLAQKYSQDDYAKQGGQLPWMSISELPQGGQLSFNTLSDNEISPPFASKFGWHIIQKVDSRKISAFRQSLRQKILNQDKLKFYLNWLKEQRKKAFVVIYENKLDLLLEDLKL